MIYYKFSKIKKKKNKLTNFICNHNIKRLNFLNNSSLIKPKYKYTFFFKNQFLSKILSKYFLVIYRRNKILYRRFKPNFYTIKLKKQKIKFIKKRGRIFYKRRKKNFIHKEYIFLFNSRKLNFKNFRDLKNYKELVVIKKVFKKIKRFTSVDKFKRLSFFEKKLIEFFRRIKKKKFSRFNFFDSFFHRNYQKKVRWFKYAFVPYNILSNHFDFLKRSKFFYKLKDLQFHLISIIRLVYSIFLIVGKRYLRKKKIQPRWDLTLVLLKVFYYFFSKKNNLKNIKDFFFHYYKVERSLKSFYRPSFFKFPLDRPFGIFSYVNRYIFRNIRFNKELFVKVFLKNFIFQYGFSFFKKRCFNVLKINSLFFFFKFFFPFFHIFGFRRLMFFRLYKMEERKLRISKLIFFTKNLVKKGFLYLVYNLLKNFNFNFFSSFNSNKNFFLKRRRKRFLLEWFKKNLGGSLLFYLLIRDFNFNFFNSFESSNFYFDLKSLFLGSFNSMKFVFQKLNFEYFREVFSFSYFPIFLKTFLRKKLFIYKFVNFQLSVNQILLVKKFKNSSFRFLDNFKKFIILNYRVQFVFNNIFKKFRTFEFKNEINFNERYIVPLYTYEVRKLLEKETLSIKEILSAPQRVQNYVKRRGIFDLSILNLNFRIKNIREIMFDFFVVSTNNPLIYVAKIIGGFYHRALAQHFFIFDYGYKNYVYLPLISTYFSTVDFSTFNNLSDFELQGLKFYKFFVDFLKYNFKRVYRCDFFKYTKKFEHLNEFFFSEIWTNSLNITKTFSDSFIDYTYGLLENKNSVIKKNRLYTKLFSKYFTNSFGKTTFLRFSNNNDLYSGETFSLVHVFKYFIKRTTSKFFFKFSSLKKLDLTFNISDNFFFCFFNLKLISFYFFKFRIELSANLYSLIKNFIFCFLVLKVYKLFIKQFFVLRLLKV